MFPVSRLFRAQAVKAQQSWRGNATKNLSRLAVSVNDIPLCSSAGSRLEDIVLVGVCLWAAS